MTFTDYLALADGEAFTHRGRTYSRRTGQVDGYATKARVSVWDAQGRPKAITLPMD